MRRWLAYSLLFVFACSVALADGAETGVITGTVIDASGSALPGVQVTLEGERAAQVAVTSEDGKFVFGLVPPGSYKLTAALEGFGSRDQAVNVSAGSRADFEMKLALSTAEQITVRGIEIKDLNQGLIDFPSLRGDRIVYLCWRLGEDRIGYWHELDAGFAGRTPI